MPGKAKTRLIPQLGAEGAAELYRRFLLDTLERACKLSAKIIVAVADGASSVEVVRGLAREVCGGAEFIAQQGADLGERMEQAFAVALSRGCPSAVVMGSDVPSLPISRVASALSLSDFRDLVVGPALDGGYYLIGMHRVISECLRGMPWGSSAVLLQTLRCAQAKQCKVSLLEPWYDVDTPADLRLLRSHLTALHLAGDSMPCPRTWEFTRRLAEEGSSG